MDIDDIMRRRYALQTELISALSTMTYSDKIKEIKQKMKENQEQCPHYSEIYNYEWVGDTCPYCGKSHCQPGGQK